MSAIGNLLDQKDAEIQKLTSALEKKALIIRATQNVIDTYKPEVSENALLHDKVFWLGQQYERLEAENAELKEWKEEAEIQLINHGKAQILLEQRAEKLQERLKSAEK